jgi:hypothetical protein
MPLPVRVKDVVDAFESVCDDWHAYINRRTGELVSFTAESAALAEKDDPDIPAWLRDDMPRIREVLESDEYVLLPSMFDFNEYRVMVRFCLSQNDHTLQESLLRAIHGSGAFRRFKTLVHDKRIADRWYEYRDRALGKFAARFLEDEGIPFVAEDSGTSR